MKDRPTESMAELSLLHPPRAPGSGPTTSGAPESPPDGSGVPSEAELLQALHRGDTRAASWLYEHLRTSIDFSLRRVLHSRHRDHDDLMQTCFERVLRALAQGRFEGRSSLRTWASAIAGHVALDALRASYRERARQNDDSSAESWSAPERSDGKLEALSELRRIQSVLSRMKPDLAETLVMADVLGHSVEEIAELRQAGLSATQSRLHRARLELRRRLGVVKGGVS